MKMKHLATISALLVLLALAAFGVNRWMGGSALPERVGQSIMPDLDMARLAKIVIESNEGSVTLNAGKGTPWTVAEQHDFPVDTKKINGLILKLSQGKVAHLITAKLEKLGGLGLLKPEENEGKREKEKTGVSIRILDSEDKPMFQIIMGNERRGQGASTFGGTYARFPDNTQAYLISESVISEFKPEDWIDTVVLDVDGKKTIKSIRIEKPGQSPLTMTRDEPESEWKVEGIAADKVNQSEVTSMVNQLAGLNIFKVARKNAPPSETGRKKTGTVRFDFFDRRSFTVDVGMDKSEDEFRYLSIQASLPPEVEDAGLKEQVEEFNRRFSARLVAVYDWDGGRLLRERTDFTVKKEK